MRIEIGWMDFDLTRTPRAWYRHLSNDNAGGNQTISLSGAPRTERYIRLYMTKVNSSYYAVNEFEVCGSISVTRSLQDASAPPIIGEDNTIEPTFYQGFPNPFNQSTSIQFYLPEEVYVTMKVYDMRGQEVATLVNENRSAGMNTVLFDGTNLANGIYFTVLQTNGVRRVLRLMLIK